MLEKSMTEFVQSNDLSEKISAVMAEYMQTVAGSVSSTLERELTAGMAAVGIFYAKCHFF